jgi:hypothetical protein
MEEIIAKYLPSSPCHSGARRSGKNHQGESSNPPYVCPKAHSRTNISSTKADYNISRVR